MRPKLACRSTVRVVALFVIAGLGAACSASSGEPLDDGQPAAVGGGGSGNLKIPNQEICGNGRDDDGDGQIDEGCGNCGTGGGTTEVPGAGCGSGGLGGGAGAGNAGSAGAGGGACTATSPTEVACADGADDDCDGKVDCDDPDCRHPGQCGCQPSELSCGDGTDDDCDNKQDCADEDCKGKCIPGSVRYCDEPNYCNWGKQSCGPDGNWGPCTEVPAPSGCEGFFLDNTYDSSCCVSKGYCCQNYPANDSIGNCAGVMACQ